MDQRQEAIVLMVEGKYFGGFSNTIGPDGKPAIRLKPFLASAKMLWAPRDIKAYQRRLAARGLCATAQHVRIIQE